MDWISKVNDELRNAKKAQNNGNHGLARVQARRAAGWAIREYLARQGEDLGMASAYEHIQRLRTRSDISPGIAAVLDHLLQRTVKDNPEEESYWPLDVDLVEEVEWLIAELFRE